MDRTTRTTIKTLLCVQHAF